MKIEHPGAPTAAKLLRIPVSLVFAWAFAATAQSSSSNGAPGAQDETPPLLQRVQVTASLIKGSDKVGYNQVQSISAVDIQGSGYTTVGEFLSNAAANSASSWSENFDYGATGGAGIALRGLSEKYTLVLIDGQRAAPFAFPSNGTDTFVDLTSIPLNMVDHIEIVKTGAVAEYGSDAISGVVNIITKHNQHGLSLTAGFGDATQGHEDTERFSLAGGFGNLGANRYNISYSVDFFKQEGYTLADRSNTSNQDYSNRTFGVNTQGASYWEPGGVGNGGSVLSPCPYGGAVVSGSTILNGPSSGSACGANTASSISLHPDEERIVPKIHAQFNLGESTEGFVDLWGSHTTTRLLQGYNGIGDGVEAYDPQTGGITQVSNLVPASNPNNPYGTAVPLTYRFEGAPQITQANSNFFRISTGLDGQFTLPRLGDWDWAATLGHSQSLVHNTESGLLNVAALENILANGQFDFSNPNATPNGLAGLYASDQNQGASKLDSVDLTASTNDLYALPGGNIGMGIGAQFLHESDLVTEYPNQAGGLAIPYSLQAIDGERDVTAAYYQFDIPITTQLSLSQSGRYDHYSDFGDAFSPRYALRFQPVRMLTAYASYPRADPGGKFAIHHLGHPGSGRPVQPHLQSVQPAGKHLLGTGPRQSGSAAGTHAQLQPGLPAFTGRDLGDRLRLVQDRDPGSDRHREHADAGRHQRGGRGGAQCQRHHRLRQHGLREPQPTDDRRLRADLQQDAADRLRRLPPVRRLGLCLALQAGEWRPDCRLRRQRRRAQHTLRRQLPALEGQSCPGLESERIPLYPDLPVRRRL